MTRVGRNSNYREIPYDWQIERLESANEILWYGRNKRTGDLTFKYRDYGSCLRDIERREMMTR